MFHTKTQSMALVVTYPRRSINLGRSHTLHNFPDGRSVFIIFHAKIQSMTLVMTTIQPPRRPFGVYHVSYQNSKHGIGRDITAPLYQSRTLTHITQLPRRPFGVYHIPYQKSKHDLGHDNNKTSQTAVRFYHISYQNSQHDICHAITAPLHQSRTLTTITLQ